MILMKLKIQFKRLGIRPERSIPEFTKVDRLGRVQGRLCPVVIEPWVLIFPTYSRLRRGSWWV